MAYELGRSVDEILDMQVDLFVEWIAWFKLKSEEEAKALKKGKSAPKIKANT